MILLRLNSNTIRNMSSSLYITARTMDFKSKIKICLAPRYL